MMQIIRCLFFLCAYFNISLRAVSLHAEHIAGKEKLSADNLSRNNS